MSMNLFSMEISDSILMNDLHYDQKKYHENEHFVSMIIYDLASAKLSSQNSDFQSAYEYSRKALTAALILNQDNEERPDLLFLSLFSHIVSCDQLGLLDEGLQHLYELKSLTNSLELEDESVEDEMIAFEYFCISLNHINEDIIKEELFRISEKFQTKAYSTFTKPFKKNQESIKSPLAKKIWKRSWRWWKKQINETCDAIKEIFKCLDLIEERTKQNKIEHNNQISSTKTRNRN